MRSSLTILGAWDWTWAYIDAFFRKYKSILIYFWNTLLGWLITLTLTLSSHGLPSECRLQAPNQTREHRCLRRLCYYWPLPDSDWGEFTHSAPLQNSVLQGLRSDSNAADSSKWDLGCGLDSGVHSNGILQHLWRPRHVSLVHVLCLQASSSLKWTKIMEV